MGAAAPRASELRSRRFYRGLLLLCLASLLLQAVPPPLVRVLWLGYLALTLYLTLGLPGAGPGHRRLGLLCSLAELLWLAGATRHHPVMGLLLLVLVILFIGRSLHGLILCLAAERRVDGPVVAGATAGYLLMGLIGGLLLTVLAGLQPGGFRDSISGQALSLPPIASLAEAGLAWEQHFQQINYFAFVSLTTVGYGDITPSRPALQLASVGLSVLGPLYITVVLGVLISRLDPLTLHRARSDRPDPPQQPRHDPPPPVPQGGQDRSRAPERPDRAPDG